MCQAIHLSVADYSQKYLAELSRHNYVTPTSYLELLGTFSKLIGIKKVELQTSKNRTKVGLDKVRMLVHIMWAFSNISSLACNKYALPEADVI